ncbi:MAG: hypothetical protein P4L77_11945 [Sulfuriferula sp.]|nr:hypothetical protein [Sulfuriferula sp.]
MNFTLPPFSLEWLMIFYIINQVASALVQSLPVPMQGGNAFYAFFYKFFSLLVADFKSFVTKIPNSGATQSTTQDGL